MRIYCIAFFKYNDGGPNYGFKRIHFQTFYSTLEKAKIRAASFFCDEAGWYEGALIEEKEEGNPFFHGQRVFFIQGEDGLLKEVPQPEWYRNTVNLI